MSLDPLLNPGSDFLAFDFLETITYRHRAQGAFSSQTATLSSGSGSWDQTYKSAVTVEALGSGGDAGGGIGGGGGGYASYGPFEPTVGTPYTYSVTAAGAGSGNGTAFNDATPGAEAELARGDAGANGIQGGGGGQATGHTGGNGGVLGGGRHATSVANGASNSPGGTAAGDGGDSGAGHAGQLVLHYTLFTPGAGEAFLNIPNVTALHRRGMVDEGGMSGKETTVFHVLKSQVGVCKPRDRVLQADGDQYVVQSADLETFDTRWRLECTKVRA